MKKCPSCKSELSPQASFCNKCGTRQPLVETPVSLIPPPPPSLVPPPPPPTTPWSEEEEKENDDESLALPFPEFWENKPSDGRLAEQLDQQSRGDHLQSQHPHSDHLRPEESHSLHRQPEETHNLHRQPQENHSLHQQPQESHSLHQQAVRSDHLQLEESYGLHQQSEGIHNLHEQSEEAYQRHQQPEKAHRHHHRVEESHRQHQQSGERYRLHEQPEESHGLYTSTIAAKTSKTEGKKGSSIGQRWVIIAVIAAVVLGTLGVLVPHLLPHHPTMSVGSPYNAQGMPVGASGTTLQVQGQGFSANSPIKFQLDSAPLQTQQTQSDSNGNVTVELAVTSAWGIGRHTLAAIDGSNVATKGIEIEIVQPGQSNTPGPNGAPSNDASFTIQLTIQGRSFTEDPDLPQTYTLIVTGHPDPEGGTVCASRDGGTPITAPGTSVNSDVTYTKIATYSCSGTYKDGMISYAETIQTQTVNYSDGFSCSLTRPQPLLQITGSYTNDHNFSGSVTEIAFNDPSLYTCNTAGSAFNAADSGTWTGTVSQS